MVCDACAADLNKFWEQQTKHNGRLIELKFYC